MEHLLYGRKVNEPEYMEQLLCTQPERFAEVRILASKDGFCIFREAKIRLGEIPNFAKSVRI